jgi:PAS domain S-box-containing protein
MHQELRILHLEDSNDDAELIELMLAQQEVACVIARVETREDFLAGLERTDIDLILSDFSLPNFDGLSALALAREKRPELPFVFVSGTLGEEVAINALKSGAFDYVLKDRLPRLGPAVTRAVAMAAERLSLQRAEAAMIQSEFKYRQLFECLSEAALLADSASGRVIDTNRQAEVLLARTRTQILGVNLEKLLSPETVSVYRRQLIEPGEAAVRVVFAGEIVPQEGRAIPVTVSAAPILLHGRRLILGLFRDVTEQKQSESEIRQLKAELQRLQTPP